MKFVKTTLADLGLHPPIRFHQLQPQGDYHYTYFAIFHYFSYENKKKIQLFIEKSRFPARAMPVFCLTHFVLTYFGSDISAFDISALA